MKELTQYQCEVCGTLYADQTKCEECEAFHESVIGVERYNYHAMGMGPESKYPYTVVLRMADGKLLTFKR